jgi:hypothetical protein
MISDQNKLQKPQENQLNQNKKEYERPCIESGEAFEKSALFCSKAAGSCSAPLSS